MKKKTILFMISHPAHFHLFRIAIEKLKERGHEVVVVIRPKDVLEQLCDNYGLDYIKVNERPQKKSMWVLALSLFDKTRKVYNIVKQKKPDLLIGSDGVLAHVGFLTRTPSFEFYEDDVQVIKLYALMFFPFYTALVSPIVTNASIWNYKKIGYNSYHKLAYLHPTYFTPEKKIVEKYFSADKSYFILRFSQLNAHHDVNIKGINTEMTQKLIDLLLPFGDVYITSERDLEPQFQKYRLSINPLDIHHILFYSKLYIGDSQSMAVEAAMLGIPSVRFSDFAGRISVLEELEHKYGLTYGIKTNQPEKLFEKTEELLTMPDLQEEFQNRRKKMLADKIDVTAFFVWFIENYPKSAEIMKENPAYQMKFK